jgi:hypothetical protein
MINFKQNLIETENANNLRLKMSSSQESTENTETKQQPEKAVEESEVEKANKKNENPKRNFN